MKVSFTAEAVRRLESQLQYLRDEFAPEASERLRLRVLSFVDQHLSKFPRTGRRIDERDIWEMWIPKTRLVVWYYISDDELVVISVWHTAQDRSQTADG